MDFSHRAIEKKWRKYWEENKTYQTTESHDKKAYILDMFPYPSGSGLHVGHVKGYTATDILSRYKRMNGYDVLHPIGYDAFGLPAEQYALKTGNDPREFTLKNINVFREQLQKLGFSYDYQKEVNTSNPNFYKTTQWIFEELYKQDLAELRFADVNWCEELGTVLANEEVLNINGQMVSEVGGFKVVKKPMKQWVLLITKYAEKLLAGLETVDWPESVKELQKNWIGRTVGLDIKFKIKDSKEKLVVFETNPMVLADAIGIALAPEHEQVLSLTTKEHLEQVKDYLELTKQKNELERKDLKTPISGVFTGSYVFNPFMGRELPIWIGDFVLDQAGMNAMILTSNGDERALDFAQTLLGVKNFGSSCVLWDEFSPEVREQYKKFATKEGPNDHMSLNLLESKNAVRKVNFKLRDWLFSRQRFYGEPFPILYTEDGNIALVEKKDLPVVLPTTAYIKPSGTGESPLANIKEWVNVEIDGKKYHRETNTMPQWAGSSWYFLAYILTNSPNDLIEITGEEAMKRFEKWLPVDLYIGGQEHAVLHLLYARFWNQVLFDLGIVPLAEPFHKLVNQGMILGPNGEKMSKSKGNVINPDEIIETHGADSLRLYEMFMGPIEASLPWSYEGLDSAMKWLNRVYRLVSLSEFSDLNNHNLDFVYHDVVKKYTNMIENLKFNTAISQLMVLVNAMYKEKDPIYKPYVEGLVKMLSIITPFLGEELYSMLGYKTSVSQAKWPEYDPKALISETTVVVFQVNGKVRGKATVLKGMSKNELLTLAYNDPNVKLYLKGHDLYREIVIPDKLVNFAIFEVSKED